ncbi:MAG: hypothetical protein COV10_04145 [Candidatus Vogelbacteria bacterium CG10_big_fil_rev_8_21_14_0_10_51_16]|uniref:Uncharacterized protein n=1 Tax=Candidatus Vogelbacteria bacterium CG10_big_fil_rev_8_21_14_0_10_51_16 TaxID=1975045 RepID=A0A2H0RDB1_9BACT|nr:MAG: hypothetical protein COV10_04145 [Candidatus Vogelbacteria bacterium CG10_big_fil_rev_8_21_14_0_10_51_16]
MPTTDQPETNIDFADLRAKLPELKQRMEKLLVGVKPASRLHHISKNLYFIAEGNSTRDDGDPDEFEAARNAIDTLTTYLDLLEQYLEILKSEADTQQDPNNKIPSLAAYVQSLIPSDNPGQE